MAWKCERCDTALTRFMRCREYDRSCCCGGSSAWGWWGWIGVFTLWIIGLRGSAAWVGILTAFVIGQTELGAGLIVVWLALLAAKLGAAWLLAHSQEPLIAATPRSLDVNVTI